MLLWIPYLLLGRTPERWWLYTWLAAAPVLIFLAFVQPIWIEPLFNDFRSLQDATLERRILETAERAGIDEPRIVEVAKSEDTNELNAYVTGIGSSARIVLWDTSVRKLSADQLVFVAAHEIGHFVHNDVIRFLVVLSGLLLGGLWSAHRASRWCLRRFATRIGFTSLDDVASLPLLVLLGNAFVLVASPAVLAFHRHLEWQADRFALELTRDNDACATAYVVAIDSDLGYPSPGPLFELWRGGHPGSGERIRFCNGYRFATPMGP